MSAIPISAMSPRQRRAALLEQRLQKAAADKTTFAAKMQQKLLSRRVRRMQATVDASNRRQQEFAERFAIFDKEVPLQRPPFYDVRLAGKSVEWTSDRLAAHTAYFGAGTYPKQMWRVDELGNRTLVMEVLREGR